MTALTTTEIAQLAHRLTAAGQRLQNVEKRITHLTEAPLPDHTALRRLKRKALDLKAEMHICEAGLRASSVRLTA